MEDDCELILEDARSIREGLWRMAQLAQDAAETLDARIEDEDLHGLAEAVEVREALEHLQVLSLEVSENLQNRVRLEGILYVDDPGCAFADEYPDHVEA